MNPRVADHLLPAVLDMRETDVTFAEEPHRAGRGGGKGIGRPSLIPIGAAIVNTVAHAIGLCIFCCPLAPERLKVAWEARCGD